VNGDRGPAAGSHDTFGFGSQTPVRAFTFVRSTLTAETRRSMAVHFAYASAPGLTAAITSSAIVNMILH
jgi:hypothetical protein